MYNSSTVMKTIVFNVFFPRKKSKVINFENQKLLVELFDSMLS